MSNHWIVILNPAARSGRGEKHWKKISVLLREADLPYELHISQHPGHCETLASQAIVNGNTQILAVGGDGTVNEIANGILKQTRIPSTDVLLGQVPLGTGNDWGRTIGIPSDYKAVPKMLKKKKTFIQDVGLVKFGPGGMEKERYFVNMAGMGYDAFVGQLANARKARGKAGVLGYIYALVKCLIKYNPKAITYWVDGTAHERELFSLVVGICKYNGGGMMQCPNAIPDDGILDMTVIHDLSKWKVLWNIRRLFTGAFVNNKEVAQYTGTSFRVAGKKPVLLEVDGENIGTGPAEFSILEKRLKVVVK